MALFSPEIAISTLLCENFSCGIGTPFATQVMVDCSETSRVREGVMLHVTVGGK